MQFSITGSLEILEKTPQTLISMLDGLSEDWILKNEGGDTWSAYDVIGHLIHGDNTDWLARAELILSDKPDKKFIPFDRFAQFNNSKGKSLHDLLIEFAEVRARNIDKLRKLDISESDLQKTGVHPAFGEVTLSQLLATWVVHDLDHIYQVSRVMAHQYRSAVGPWIEYLKILRT